MDNLAYVYIYIRSCVSVSVSVFGACVHVYGIYNSYFQPYKETGLFCVNKNLEFCVGVKCPVKYFMIEK